MLAATLLPASAVDGDSLTLEVSGLDAFVGSAAQIEVRGIDDVATQWVASTGATADAAGVARAVLSMNLGRETTP